MKKEVNRNTYGISSLKRITRKFLEVSRCSCAKQRQRNLQKSVLHVQSCVFANRFGRCRRRLELHDFIFCSSKL